MKIVLLRVEHEQNSKNSFSSLIEDIFIDDGPHNLLKPYLRLIFFIRFSIWSDFGQKILKKFFNRF